MPFKHSAARRRRMPRARDRITNGPASEAGLRRRGDLTLWLDEAALTGWAAPKRSSPGGQPLYADLAIERVLTLRLVFHLALRQAGAFARRQPRVAARDGPIHLVLDSTGLELLGQAEGAIASPPLSPATFLCLARQALWR